MLSSLLENRTIKTFTDNAGRTWTVQVNVDAIKRVRDLAKVDLPEVVEGKLIKRLLSAPVLLGKAPVDQQGLAVSPPSQLISLVPSLWLMHHDCNEMP